MALIAVGAATWYRHLMRGATPPYPGNTVPCGSCVACCHHVKVDLFPPHDDPTQFETEIDSTNRITLKQQPNGDCIYLQESRCTIYARRPAVCRSFDCRALLVTDVHHPLHVWTAARERFDVVAKAPGDAQLLETFHTKARLLEARYPDRAPATIVQAALTRTT